MQERLTPEEQAQKALEYLSQAEQYEEDMNYPKAIECYSNAANLLNESGYLTHRIDDIYTRMTELNSVLQQEKDSRVAIQADQIDAWQDQAFAILDEAKAFESQARIEEAMDKYMAAISLLAQAGWSESQLDNIKSKVQNLGMNLQRQKQQRELQYSQQQAYTPAPTQPQAAPVTPGLSPAEQKAAQLKAYEEKKRREDDMQSEAFSLIDNAKKLEKDKNFDDAIANYQRAIELLNALGWTQQTQNMQSVIEKLKRDKALFESQAQQIQQAEVMMAGKTIVQSSEPQSEAELRKLKLLEFEEKKRREEEAQTKAFNLVDIGKRLERDKNYEGAIQNYEEAINLLRSIGWDAYVQPIISSINGVKEKQQKEIQAEELKRKRDAELESLQKTIQIKQKEEFVQSAQEAELKKQKFEQEKLAYQQKEAEFFGALDKADSTLKGGDYIEALKEYQNVMGMLQTLGSGWESYIPTIQSTISVIQQKIQEQSEVKKQDEQRKQKQLEFQKELAQKTQAERESLRQREIALKAREDELKYREERKNVAFQFLDSAQVAIKQGDYDKAIHAYQSAGSIFAEIQWTDEIPLIENSIKELEKKREEQKIGKQKQMEQEIERRTREKEFQKEIARQTQEEREKLKQKEIELREQQSEIEYREKMKEETFNYLEEAKDYIKQGDFEKAIDIYRDAAFIFAEIQWHDEIEVIQNAIVELENKKREADIRKQRELEANIQREAQERLFQEQMEQEMKARRERLKQKELTLREQESEVKYREERREDAFKLMDEAKLLLSKGNFDKALDYYHEVTNIFAEIQWTDELSLIQDAIRDIEEKKKEKELWIQKKREEAIRKEAEQRTYVDQVKKQRDIEKAKMSEQKDLIEKQKALSSQLVEKQTSAFKMIEDGDLLLKQENFDKAIEEYQKAIAILTEIGWEGGYLRLLRDTLEAIQIKKQERDKQLQLQVQMQQKQQEEQRLLQQSIAEGMEKEKERMRTKKIEIQKREAMANYYETRKNEAFGLMDEGMKLLNKGEYEQSIEKYRQAQLILSEIQFPVDSVQEMIISLQEKKREADIAKQQRIEAQIQREQEQKVFQTEIAERMATEEEKMKSKKVEIQKQEELQAYLEKRKTHAFDLLEQAENATNRGHYDRALEYYHSAELILGEINFPTGSIKETIMKVEEKKKEQDLQKQRELELSIAKEKEEREYQQRITEGLDKEKERMQSKLVQIQQMEQLKEKLEQRKEEAFKILDEAENNVKYLEYDKALENYRKAELILNEIQFPTDSVREMQVKVMNLKREKEMLEEYGLQARLQKLEEEKELQAMLDERKRQEKEKKLAQQEALFERERIIQEQMNARDASYALLEKASKYLKTQIPDYDKAISLYVQARDTLAENIGWEPEINNINGLIRDLEQEKANYFERKRLEELAALKRQEEYDLFQQEIDRKAAEEERERQEQRSQLRIYEERRLKEAQMEEESLNMIDEGKKLASNHRFKEAFQTFQNAINRFRELGWIEQIPFIQKEMENTKVLQDKYEAEQAEMQRIRRDLEQQRELEMQRRQTEQQQIVQSAGEASNLASEISGMIRTRQQEMVSAEQRKKELTMREAKEFSKNLAKMMRIKQELKEELERKKAEAKKAQEEEIKKKDRAKLDDISQMLKDLKKKG